MYNIEATDRSVVIWGLLVILCHPELCHPELVSGSSSKSVEMLIRQLTDSMTSQQKYGLFNYQRS